MKKLILAILMASNLNAMQMQIMEDAATPPPPRSNSTLYEIHEINCCITNEVKMIQEEVARLSELIQTEIPSQCEDIITTLKRVCEITIFSSGTIEQMVGMLPMDDEAFRTLIEIQEMECDISKGIVECLEQMSEVDTSYFAQTLYDGTFNRLLEQVRDAKGYMAGEIAQLKETVSSTFKEVEEISARQIRTSSHRISGIQKLCRSCFCWLFG
jgi:hypothetical protein